MRRPATIALCLALAAGCRQPPSPTSTWRLSEQSPVRSVDEALLGRISRALDAAAQAGTDPSISKHHVRAATVVEHEGQEQVVVGGNTEYGVPEAVHGEVSLMNHVTARFGADLARAQVQFIAFYAQSCGDSRGCGDCRDYMRAATRYASLLWVCGQQKDHTIHVRRFADGLLEEEKFPDASPDQIDLPKGDLDALLVAARTARTGGVTLFNPSELHTAAAVLTWSGRIYRAAGADDAAFHYRYPIGGALQQAATEKDYLPRAVAVVGVEGAWPRVSYRDRQYGFEASSFATSQGKPPTLLVLADGPGRLKATTFEAALPHPFSVARFNPGAIERFLKRQQ
jgi:cytidine deaminase